MYIPHVINENTITVIIDGKPLPQIPSTHPNFAKIKGLLITGEHDSVPALVDIAKSIESIGNGDIQIRNGAVFFQDMEVPRYQSDKLISMHKKGAKNINPLKNFITRLMKNPSMRAREEFARFAEYKELPFDEDGFVYAWKGVELTDYSVMGNTRTRILKGVVNEGGHILNSVGAEIECNRADVDDDATKYCSKGLHVGSFNYARGWGKKVKLVKLDPADVVSVPYDCEGQKCRVCHYWVVADYNAKNPIEEPVVDKEGREFDKVKKEDSFTEEQYFKKFKQLVKKYNLTYGDESTILELMDKACYFNTERVLDMVYGLKLTNKIANYINGHTDWNLKKIQSSLKAYSLKQEEISRLIKQYGSLFGLS